VRGRGRGESPDSRWARLLREPGRASQAEINQRVTDLVRSEVQSYLAQREQTIAPERIVVRVFGGVW